VVHLLCKVGEIYIAASFFARKQIFPANLKATPAKEADYNVKHYKPENKDEKISKT
jgi:hypothetical protein